MSRRPSATQRVQGAEALPAHLRGGVVAIGNFDGVHRGHQAVLERAMEEARRLDAPALALTFEPHPRELFRPDQPVFRLTPAPARARLLGLLGFDAVVEQPFTQAFSQCSPEAFVDDILVDALGIRHVVTGFDFHFGEKRRGGPAFLMEAGERRGFGVSLVDAFRDEGAHVVSSSRIRDLLEEGEVAEAAGLLGYRYFVEGEVVGGKKLGRTLGYPTANMVLPDCNGLRHGIYAVRFTRGDGTVHDGVASFGRRPTFDNGAPLLEIFLFDFKGDLYGKTLDVAFITYIRDELKFDGIEALIRQMDDDSVKAHAALAAAPNAFPKLGAIG